MIHIINKIECACVCSTTNLNMWINFKQILFICSLWPGYKCCGGDTQLSPLGVKVEKYETYKTYPYLCWINIYRGRRVFFPKLFVYNFNPFWHGRGVSLHKNNVKKQRLVSNLGVLEVTEFNSSILVKL